MARGVTQYRWDYVNFADFRHLRLHRHSVSRAFVFPLGGQGGFQGESLAGFGSAMERAAASSRCAGPARVSQPLCLYWAGRRKLRRVGINQPQADRFLALTLELVLPSIEVRTLAYGTGGAGARNGRESVTGALWRGRNSLAVELA